MNVLHTTYIEDDKLSYTSDKLLTGAQTFTNHNVEYRKLILFDICFKKHCWTMYTLNTIHEYVFENNRSEAPERSYKF